MLVPSVGRVDRSRPIPYWQRDGISVQAFILETVEMIHELDDTRRRHEMSPLFCQHGYGQVRMSLRDLLTILGHDPDA